MKISIIIPVYNTEQYLHACLDSILSQSFADYEVLLIDDGSTDGSGSICDAYAQRDSRVLVFHKENGGVSSARNLGLDNARGEWVYFVDSDDEILSEGLQTMVDCISEDVDIVLAGFEQYDEDGRIIYGIKDRIVTILEKKESLSTLYETHGKYYDYLTLGCIRLLRNSLIDAFHLRFDTTITNKEDTLFVTQYICKSNGRTRFTTTPVYKYNRRPGSEMEKWRASFNFSYISSLSALIKMKREISNYYSPLSSVVFIAKEGIWIRYNRILNKMRKSNFRDDELVRSMSDDIKRELGLSFFVMKKIRKWKRKLS